MNMRSPGGMRGVPLLLEFVRIRHKLVQSRPAPPEGGGGFNRFAHSAGPSYFGCLPGGLLVCCLCVCLYVLSIVESSCAQFGSLSWGPSGLHFGSSGGRLGTILGSVGSSWGRFGGSGAALGSIFGALGLLWCLWGSLGAPLGRPRCPKPNFPTFFPPILGSFWLLFGGKNR